MLRLALPLIALAAPQAVSAQTAPLSEAQEGAKPATADAAALPADDAVTAPPEPSSDAPAAPQPAVAAASGSFTLDTPIAVLIADPAAKAVLDRDLPGLSEDQNLARFEAKSLREFQPLTGGQLDDALLAKVGSDLAAIDSEPAPATATKRKHVEGR